MLRTLQLVNDFKGIQSQGNQINFVTNVNSDINLLLILLQIIFKLNVFPKIFTQFLNEFLAND